MVKRILDFLVDRMQIDEAWSVREEESLTWWASSLAQRVWSDPARELQGVEVTTLHLETDLLSGVRLDEATWQRLAGLNRFASMSAYVADQLTASIRLHASVSITEDNWLMARTLALHAMALQVADAHSEAEPLADAFGAAVARSGHPDRGSRKDPDEMLGVVEIYRQRGQDDSPFDADELADLVHIEPRPWVLAANELHRLDAELTFTTDTTARLEFDNSISHPALGSGLQMRLVLPVEPDAAIAQKLNANERLEPDAHQLGAWCVDDEDGLLFSAFIPSAAHVKSLSRAMAYHMSARNDWARALLFPTA
ncbi:MAG: hypothetical protein ACRD2N_03295 [Vicinamibacterales bacterium]